MDVSTKSIEAYRYYVEGIDLHNRAREIEAIPLLEKAVQADPTFAMALAKLAIVEGNVGHPLKREEYAKRALENIDRLTARERYYIEGFYYSNKTDQIGRAIEAYKKAIDLYPDHASARHNLALLYSGMGRTSEAIPLYEELRRRGMAFPTTYTNLASTYVTDGQLDKANAVLQEYVQANGNVSQGHYGLGNVYAAMGKWDEALAAYDKATALVPAGNPQPDGQQARRLHRDRALAGGRQDQRQAAAVERSEMEIRRAHEPGERPALQRPSDRGALRLYDSAAAASGPRGSVQSAAARLGPRG